jgi:membrane-associated HD superfamily phosphohydrolase
MAFTLLLYSIEPVANLNFKQQMNNNKRIRTSVILSVSLLSLTFLDYYWQQISEFAPPIGMTLILILAILIISKLLSTGLTVLKQRTNLSTKVIIPTIIYLFTLLLIFFQPSFLNPSNYQGEVKFRGCYEGTMNTGTLLFRETGNFEYRHVGFFGITTFEKGTWKQSGDTLLIDFNNETPEFVGSKLLMTDERFIKIDGDSLIVNRLGFYRGFCKGLN